MQVLATYAAPVLVSTLALLSSPLLRAQNVSIAPIPTPPAGDAGLDVNFTNRGLLIPRVSLSNTGNYGLVGGGPTTSMLVYNTNGSITGTGAMGTGYYYWNGTRWAKLLVANSPSDAWLTSGNAGTTAGTNFLGTTDAVHLVFKTNNTERMRITSGGNIIAGVTTPVFGADLIEGVGVYPINGYGTGAGSMGVYGASNAANGLGVYGRNSNSSGTGIIGGGNGVNPSYLVAGSGGAFTGSQIGIAVFKNGGLTNNQGAGYFLASSTSGVGVYVAYRNNLGTNFKILNVGAFGGSVSTDVWGLSNDPNDRKIMFCPEAPEILLEDYGVGQLINGKAHIDLDPIFAKNIVVNEKHPLRVFIQLKGNCNGVYVTNESQNGFDVIELNNGQSNVKFIYHVVANRADYIHPITGELISKHEGVRFPPAPNPPEIKQISRKKINLE